MNKIINKYVDVISSECRGRTGDIGNAFGQDSDYTGLFQEKNQSWTVKWLKCFFFRTIAVE